MSNGSRLCIAALQHDCNAVKELVRDPDVDRFIDFKESVQGGRNALHEACMRGYDDIASILIDQGASYLCTDSV